jgi:hypothetical protein
MSHPPASWLVRREAEAIAYEESGETYAAEFFRKETAEIAQAYAAEDPAAKLSVALDLREPGSFTNADWEALEAIKADTEASVRFTDWSMLTADNIEDARRQ